MEPGEQVYLYDDATEMSTGYGLRDAVQGLEQVAEYYKPCAGSSNEGQTQADGAIRTPQWHSQDAIDKMSDEGGSTLVAGDDLDLTDALITPFSNMEDIDFSLYDSALDSASFVAGGHEGEGYDLDYEDFSGEESADLGAYGYLAHEYSQEEHNLDVTGFIKHYLIRRTLQLGDKSNPHRTLSTGSSSFENEVTSIQERTRAEHTHVPRNHHYLDFFELQDIPWKTELGIDRSHARNARDRLYHSYQNLKFEPHGFSRSLPEKLNSSLFVPKSMHTKHKGFMTHFQLRNLMSVIDEQTLMYSDRHKVYQLSPYSGERKAVIDLSQNDNSTSYASPVEITTMTTGRFPNHEIVIAGGFHAEYAMKSLHTTDSSTVTGLTTDNMNGITNFIEVFSDRLSGLPRAGFSCNDRQFRVLDCSTNTFVTNHHYPWAVNCTETSPDGRLRVMVGDSPEALIVNAETGRCERILPGHQDFGFACAWSPDSHHVATANQDKTVNIWDVRTWNKLSVIEADVSSYRSLRFSPVGGGARCLLMAESADRVAVVDAQCYDQRIVHDFFGEIGGIGFAPDGGNFWVANMDRVFGGFMAYERRGTGQQVCGNERTTCGKNLERLDNENSPRCWSKEWISESERENDNRVVDRWRAREQDIMARQMEDRIIRRYFPKGYRFDDFPEM